jgi:hypothetical protein
VVVDVSDVAAPLGEGVSTQPLVTALWYPLDRWPVGEAVAANTELWPVEADFRVCMAVIRGGDWTDGDRRLSIQMPSPPSTGDSDGEGWACVLQIREGEVVAAETTTD